MSTLAVVEQILRETEAPMSVRQIVEYGRGRLPTRSKTPDTVVARDLSMDIKKKGDASIFIRTEPGRYTLRELVRGDAAPAVRQEDGEREPPPDAIEPTTPLASTAIQIERAATRAARASSESESAAQSTIRNA